LPRRLRRLAMTMYYSSPVIARSVATKQSHTMNKQYFGYVVTNDTNTVTYTGVTNDLKRRAYEHKEKLGEGFTKKYNLSKLVYYEVVDNV